MKFFFSGFLEIFSGYFFNHQIWPLTGWSQHLFCHGALRAEGLGGSRQTPPLRRGECQTHLPPASPHTLLGIPVCCSTFLYHQTLNPAAAAQGRQEREWREALAPRLTGKVTGCQSRAAESMSMATALSLTSQVDLIEGLPRQVSPRW